MNLDFNKVLVGVSGGVDSSVCIDLLQKQGLEVEGVVIRFSPESEEAVQDAQKVCDKLGIKLHVADAQEAFKKYVVISFCENYVNGMTPNPCIVCNPYVKFATIIAKADELGIGYIATGHYAQTEKINDLFYVKKAISVAKDQSYMLYRLKQDVLSRLLLPIGSYEKPDIRTMAGDIGLFNADKPDSQEICFIPDGNHGRFIENLGYKTKYGWFISPEGKKIKKHNGVHNYTVGQRKHLGIALGKPAFVKEIQENGNILLGYAGDEFFTSVELSSPVYTEGKSLNAGDVFTVKVRSASKGDQAKVVYSDDEKVILEFLQPVRAAARGQSVVIYNGDYVMGGGFIAKAVQ
ncbi:MAG: tRNA 2-thiouridine(34) synthase MnmA [Oscillospiraceae bacterium]|nr:tRNA 2-thiouridine(34) synthase MnmA [Oscillospiraceae bacterium]